MGSLGGDGGNRGGGLIAKVACLHSNNDNWKRSVTLLCVPSSMATMNSPIHGLQVSENGRPMENLGARKPAALEKLRVDRASKAQVVDHHSWVEESGLTDWSAFK